MNRLRLGMFILLVLLTASTAFAQYTGGPRNQDVPDPCPTYDSCTMSGGSTSYPPTITACTATGAQRCRTCNPVYTANGALYGYKCESSTENASCECTPKAKTSGCNLKGTCTYTDDI